MNANRISSNRTVAGMAIALATAIHPFGGADGAGRFGRSLPAAKSRFRPAGHGCRTRDTNLVNAWGIAFNPFAFVWVSDNGSGLSTLYNGIGTPQGLVVVIPPAAHQDSGNPTGIVFNGNANAFKIPTPTDAAP